MKRINQNGFALVEICVIVVIIAVAAFIGYRVMSSRSATSTKSSSSSVVSKVPSSIKSKADVKAASKALDAADINSKLDPNQLDSSIKSLL